VLKPPDTIHYTWELGKCPSTNKTEMARKVTSCNNNNNNNNNGHVARMGEARGVYRILLGKPEGKRPLGRPRHRWVGNISMDLQ